MYLYSKKKYKLNKDKSKVTVNISKPPLKRLFLSKDGLTYFNKNKLICSSMPDGFIHKATNFNNQVCCLEFGTPYVILTLDKSQFTFLGHSFHLTILYAHPIKNNDAVLISLSDKDFNQSTVFHKKFSKAELEDWLYKTDDKNVVKCIYEGHGENIAYAKSYHASFGAIDNNFLDLSDEAIINRHDFATSIEQVHNLTLTGKGYLGSIYPIRISISNSQIEINTFRITYIRKDLFEVSGKTQIITSSDIKSLLIENYLNL